LRRIPIWGLSWGAAALIGLIGSLVSAPALAYDITVSAPLTSEAQAASVLTYWLRDGGRALEAATPYRPDIAITPRRVLLGGPHPDGRPGSVSPGTAQRVAPASAKHVGPPRTLGKAFFVGADGRPHWCSATAVQSTHRNLVATAGHCVFDPASGKPHRRWIFIPGHQRGRFPYGIFLGKQAFTHRDFAKYRDADRDYAFVAVYDGLAPRGEVDLANRARYAAFTGGIAYRVKTGGTTRYVGVTLTRTGRLGDLVGGQGIAYNLLPGRSVRLAGHPAPAPGKTRAGGGDQTAGAPALWSGRTFKAEDAAIKAELLLGVRSTAPSLVDGALWLTGYRKSTGLGYLNGITIATAARDGAGVSPYFDGELFTVYTAARAARAEPISFGRTAKAGERGTGTAAGRGGGSGSR